MIVSGRGWSLLAAPTNHRGDRIVQLSDVVAHAPEIVSQEVDGEAVLVDPKQGMVRVLNATGALIWDHVDGRHTVADLATTLVATYGIEEARAQADVSAFCTNLMERGALMIVS